MISVSGEITAFAAAHLILELRAGKRTGTAVFENGEAIKKVYIKEGEVVFAASNLEADSLGQVLLRAEIIKKTQYDASLEQAAKNGKKQGAALVELGFLKPQDLVWGVQLQIMKILQSIFAWPAGRFRLDEGPLPVAEIIPLKMSFRDSVVKALRGLDWKDVRKALPPVNTVLKPLSAAAVPIEAADLSQDQRTVLSLIDGKRSIEEICSLAGSGDYNTLKAIHFFLSLRMAETGEIKTESEMASVRTVVQEAAAREERTPVSKPAAAPSEMKLSLRKAFDELEGKTHYQLLGVEESASAGEIKKAYFRLAKLYHPDRHRDPEMQDMKVVLETLFARLTEAYNIVSDDAKREQYNFTIAKGPKKVVLEEDKTDRAGNAVMQFNAGVQEYKRGNFWGAFEAFRWAARLEPGNPKYYYHQGLAVARMPRRANEAEESFKKAIELDPSNAAYYLELGNLYLKGGLKAKALAVFQEAGNWDPDSEKIRKAVRAAGGAAEEPEKTKGGVFSRLFGGGK